MPNQPGLDGRHRDQDGEIDKKRRDTQIGTLRETYGDKFAQGRRADMELGTLLDETGCATLSEYMKKHG